MTGNQQTKTIKGPATLVDIHSSGRSMAIFEDKKTYVDFGIPGEIVCFMSHRRTQGFRSGEVVEVIEPSPDRIIPFCEHSRECGGCPWQHIRYEHQLELKRRILTDALKKYGVDTPPVPAVIASPKMHYYRHRVEYAFSGNHQNALLGFHKYNEPGHVTGINHCWLQEQPSRDICEFTRHTAIEKGLTFYNNTLKAGFLRSLSIRTNLAGHALVIVGFHEDQPEDRNALLSAIADHFGLALSLGWTIHQSAAHSQLQGELHAFAGHSLFFHEQLNDLGFRIHASSFFQPNALQASVIFKTIGEWADLIGNEKVYDLYTGVGTIALSLASRAGHITGIEGSSMAIADAKYNAELNGIENVEFLTGDILETFKAPFIHQHGNPDLIVLDPPRSGTLIEIKKSINASGARKVIYLSCNPVSLAFDLKQLTEVYRVTHIQPFDMLPNTHHLETLVMLGK